MLTQEQLTVIEEGLKNKETIEVIAGAVIAIIANTKKGNGWLQKLMEWLNVVSIIKDLIEKRKIDKKVRKGN